MKINLNWQQIVLSAGGFLIGVVSNVFANYISGIDGLGLSIGLAILALSVLVVAVVGALKPKFTRIRYFKQLTLRTPHERKTAARKGLIVVVPWYNGKIEPPNTIEMLRKETQLGNYSEMDFEGTNFAHVVEAIVSHATRLEHCWLISTTNTDPKDPCSKDFVPALIRFLQEKRDIKCKFHWEEHTILLDDDAQVTDRTLNQVRSIYQQAQNLGLVDKDILADFTGGLRSIALGIFLSSLDGNRDIQFIGTHYDEKGRPTGDRYPMISQFELQTTDSP